MAKKVVAIKQKKFSIEIWFSKGAYSTFTFGSRAERSAFLTGVRAATNFYYRFL